MKIAFPASQEDFQFPVSVFVCCSGDRFPAMRAFKDGAPIRKNFTSGKLGIPHVSYPFFMYSGAGRRVSVLRRSGGLGGEFLAGFGSSLQQHLLGCIHSRQSRLHIRVANVVQGFSAHWSA